MTGPGGGDKRWYTCFAQRLLNGLCKRTAALFSALRAFNGRLFIVSPLAALVCGCTVHHSLSESPAEHLSENSAIDSVTLPDQFSRSGSMQLNERWWQTFKDPALDQLITKALRKNLDLKAAYQRLERASALVREQGDGRFPELDSFLSAEKTDSDTVDSETIELGLSAAYELDLWGRIGSRIAAENYRYQATALDLKAAGLTLSSLVAQTWYQLTEATDQVALITQQVDANRKVLTLIESRLGIGNTSSADVLRQEQLLEATREQRIAAEQRVRLLQYRLAVLTGEAPRSIALPATAGLPDIPPLPDTGLPAGLVNRRPDIQAVFQRLAASNAELAATVSERYPRISLSASVSTLDDDSRELFDDWLKNLAANLVVPLIDGGERRARVDVARAEKQALLFTFGQSVLEAFEEVESALTREAQQARRIDSLARQLQFAGQTYEQLRVEYFNGAGNYIDVLTALTDVQQLRRDLLSARLELLEFRIALYRALAGGFNMAMDEEGH